MRFLKRKVTWMCAVALPVLLLAQTGNLSIISGVINFGSASHTATVKIVASTGALPSSGCTVGELAIVTGATLGQQIYTNSGSGTCTWTQMTGAVTSVGGQTGAVSGEGNGTKVQMFTGSDPSTNNCAKFDSNHNVTDAGNACGVGTSSQTLLETHDASNSAQLSFTTCINSTNTNIYRSFRILIDQLVPSNNLDNINFNFSTDGGATWDTGTNYAFVGNRQSNAGSANNIGNSAQTLWGMDVGGGVSSTASRGGLAIEMILNLRNLGTIRPKMHLYGTTDDGSSNVAVVIGASGTYTSTTAVNAFRLIGSTGNLASGGVSCYGISH